MRAWCQVREGRRGVLGVFQAVCSWPPPSSTPTLSLFLQAGMAAEQANDLSLIPWVQSWVCDSGCSSFSLKHEPACARACVREELREGDGHRQGGFPFFQHLQQPCFMATSSLENNLSASSVTARVAAEAHFHLSRCPAKLRNRRSRTSCVCNPSRLWRGDKRF